jgi:hypothetical protein
MKAQAYPIGNIALTIYEMANATKCTREMWHPVPSPSCTFTNVCWYIKDNSSGQNSIHTGVTLRWLQPDQCGLPAHDPPVPVPAHYNAAGEGHFQLLVPRLTAKVGIARSGVGYSRQIGQHNITKDTKHKSSRSRAGFATDEPRRRIFLTSIVKRPAVPVVFYYALIRL